MLYRCTPSNYDCFSSPLMEQASYCAAIYLVMHFKSRSHSKLGSLLPSLI